MRSGVVVSVLLRLLAIPVFATSSTVAEASPAKGVDMLEVPTLNPGVSAMAGIDSNVQSNESKVAALEGGENEKSKFAGLTIGVVLIGEGPDRKGVGGGRPLGS